ncbi:Homeobox domain [Dillenia turbinata]|uniref:Homeobox-leucine zipper protein n=1 Tax=Dillenia turbinata TaxID=194707 RepID=A0AAN8UMH6_9MAGN
MGLNKARKKRLTGVQVGLLESSFNSNRRLDAQRKLQLATALSLPPRQVAIWYQNRRARHKNQTIELDYKTIQIKLDSTLVEKERLEREVDLLKQQLHKAHEMLLTASDYPPAFPLSSHSASDGGDDGGSSFPGRMDGSWGSPPIEELYATCLASPEHQPEKEYPHPHDFWAPSVVYFKNDTEEE